MAPARGSAVRTLSVTLVIRGSCCSPLPFDAILLFEGRVGEHHVGILRLSVDSRKIGSSRQDLSSGSPVHHVSALTTLLPPPLSGCPLVFYFYFSILLTLVQPTTTLMSHEKLRS